MARNAPLASWAVNDAFDRPLRLYRPTPSSPYYGATWYEPSVERQQHTTLGRAEAEARRWCIDKAHRLTKAQRRRRPDRPLLPGRCLVEEYLNPDNQPGWGSPNTIMKAAAHARCAVPPRLLELPCEQWTTEDLRQAILDAVARGLRRSTLTSVRNTLGGIVRVGVDLHYLDADQINMASVRVPRNAGQSATGNRAGVPHRQNLPNDDGFTFRIERRHLPSLERIDAIVAQLPHPYDTMVALTAHAGPRWAEVAALEFGDVDTTERTIRICRTAVEAGGLTIRPPKNRRHRLTFYPEFLAPSIEKVCDEARARAADGGSSLLFPSRKDTILRRSNFNRRYWQAARNEVGWQPGWTFHTLRHCAAIWMLYDMHFDVHDVAEVLGHADPTVTQRIYVQSREGVASRLAQQAG